ncbi:sigma-54 interaction domain-containing protein [Clostridium sp. FP1]|uniref:sigma-54 interaction domain-containing protein n=1 Tax=Clostridium sp. FP1 TaxID=2724076 RepID=UPI0013E929BA|nr:sigma 54-interacting transcriptional regulator [Clostridium sp. FP1]MBZ9633779.1 sigma 54-interacting transcriptional regulator [Clostridium sp. FP1]
MVKVVAIVTSVVSAAKFYKEQLKELFGELIDVKLFSFEDNSISKIINADLVMAATYSVYETIKNNISDECEIVIPNLTLSKIVLKQIKKISSGTKCMLVNSSVDMCIDTISLFTQLGINHLELIPVYPGINEIPKLDFAITPGESKFVPENVKNVMNIGDRILDTSTIIEIVLKLNLEYLLKEDKFVKYSDRVASNSYSLEELAGKTNKLESQFDILLKVLDEGIIGVNANGIVFAFNNSAERIIGKRKDEVLGKPAIDIISDIHFNTVINTLQPIQSKLIKINDVYIDFNFVPVISENKSIGAFAIIKKFKDSEYRQQKLRLQLLNRGYRAKYSFEDIIGESSIIVKTKNIAEKMSKTNSPVLITGESGTGKELFAQALHRSSPRKEFPFVAVNCAAIPENLLESELFGYEEGAFTGAKKGGRLGLFEFAHTGTLFLDEIEGMSFNLQSKLLRILQEKEVVRIGGDRVINVDVRIIAATNIDIKELVCKGDFRKDLYYRLNVLPLNIPPLRDRGQDILLIMEKLKQDLESKIQLSEEIKKIFLAYTWEGNIRELRNYMEYLTCISEGEITVEDLPFNLSNSTNNTNIKTLYENTEFKDFMDMAGKKLSNYLLVLEELAVCYKNRVGIGRRAIAKIVEEKNIFLTEPEIRTIFVNLEKYKMIIISKGRGGSRITDLGLKFLNDISAPQVMI